MDGTIDFGASEPVSSQAVVSRLSFFPFKSKRLRLSRNFLSRNLKNLEKDLRLGNKGSDVSYRLHKDPDLP